MDVSAFSSGWGECVSRRTHGVVYLFQKPKDHRSGLTISYYQKRCVAVMLLWDIEPQFSQLRWGNTRSSK
ncbi:hypothetical protein Q8A67_023485 [Cirrhinus molitorella]|uniref:Uncharacterized protein n=1 Tax=Cirrhinus molitorella TaxID=172907 RepID=A0AA88P659_9TELE|nr:hypothetical protein Q8A67_023485 [Cirrhinus molitorella]